MTPVTEGTKEVGTNDIIEGAIIDPLNPPAAGTVFIFEPNTIIKELSLPNLTFIGIGKNDCDSVNPNQEVLKFDAVKDISDEPLFIDTAYWNETFAQRVSEIRYPDAEVVAGSGEPVAGEDAPANDNPQSTIHNPPAAILSAAGNIASPAGGPPKAEMSTIPIDCIDLAENVRSSMSEQGLFELAESIKDVGQLEPVIVRKQGNRFVLIAGFRRLEAVKKAGEDMIEAKVYKNLTDDMAAQMQLTENLQREDLNHIDIARTLGKARDAGMSVTQIAEKIHTGDDYVRRHLELLRLAEPIQQLVASGRLPLKQAELIARVGDQKQQMRLTERTLDLRWEEKKKQWVPFMQSHGMESDTPDDHVDSMDELRAAVASACLSLAACGWPMDEEYPDGIDKKNKKRPCIGCPDNTSTYADQPMLFAGIRPQGSDKKGYCSNEACYRCKELAWGKVREQRAAERKAKTKEKIAKAKKAGLNICEDCGKVADADQTFKEHEGSKLCPKCIEKAKKRGRRGDSWNEQERKKKELERKFPWTDEQRFALSLFDYGQTLAKAIEDYLKSCAPKNLPSDVLMILLRCTVLEGGYRHNVKGIPSYYDLMGGKQILPECLSKIWSSYNPAPASIRKPSIGWGGEVKNVPVSKENVTRIQILEDLAKHWKVANLPDRPTIESVRLNGFVQVVQKGKLADAQKTVAECKDKELLQKAGASETLPMNRRKLIEDRIAEMNGHVTSKPKAKTEKKTAAKVTKGKASRKKKTSPKVQDTKPQPEPPAADDSDGGNAGELVDVLAVCAIRTGKKADALAAITTANLATITHASGEPLKGDWRRAAVAKREKELQKETK